MLKKMILSSLFFSLLVSGVVFAEEVTVTSTPSVTNSLSDSGKIKIPGNTIIKVKTEGEITSEKAKVGDKITLLVVSDVVIDNVVVIKAGAPSLAEVDLIQKRGAVGKQGKIGVSLLNVQLIDGSVIPLSGKLQYEGKNKTTSSVALSILTTGLFLLKRGQEGIIPDGTEMDALVVSDTYILVSPAINTPDNK